MKMFTRLVAAALLASVGAFAQQCVVSFTLDTVLETSNQQDNRTQGCVNWAVTYNSTGFSALTLTFQSAANAGSPSFVTFAGTVDTGINPNTSTTAAYSQFTGYFPYQRVVLAAATGTGVVRGVFYGWRAESGGGSVPTPLPVEGCGPVAMPPACNPVVVGDVNDVGDVVIPLVSPIGAAAGSVFNGVGWQSLLACTNQLAVEVTAMGNTQLIPLTMGKLVKVCHVSVSGDSVVNVKFTTGTGSNCATGTANLTGAYRQVDSLALDFSSLSPLSSPGGQAVCLNLSAASNWGGVILYALLDSDE